VVVTTKGPLVGPPPVGWYEDPYEVGLLRFHDGTRWTEQTTAGTASLAASAGPSAESLPDAPWRPAPTWRRALLMVAGVAPFGVLGLVMAQTVTGAALFLVVHLVAIGVAAPYVSYRRRDAFAMLIPIYNTFLIYRIAWRLAYLPYRDWEPRADEAAHWRRLRNVEHPWRPLYLPEAAPSRRANAG
jgi:hypothetical protein